MRYLRPRDPPALGLAIHDIRAEAHPGVVELEPLSGAGAADLSDALGLGRPLVVLLDSRFQASFFAPRSPEPAAVADDEVFNEGPGQQVDALMVWPADAGAELSARSINSSENLRPGP